LRRLCCDGRAGGHQLFHHRAHGQPAPGAPFNYDMLRSGQIHDDGRITFYNITLDPDRFDPMSIFIGTPGNLALLVSERQEQPVPNSSDDAKFTSFGAFDFSRGMIALTPAMPVSAPRDRRSLWVPRHKLFRPSFMAAIPLPAWPIPSSAKLYPSRLHRMVMWLFRPAPTPQT